jgi:small GTP-binding protein
MLRNTFNSLCTKYRSRTWHWIQQRRQSGPAKSAPNTVALPGYMRAKDLAKKLNTDVDSVTRYCKQHGHSCRKASELIVDYATAQSLARDRGITALYQELDISRRDYWSRDHNQATRARPLVVLVIGRVNSGKTTLLDLLRRRGGLQSQIAPYEPGLITQDYHAFTIEHGPHTPITWIDTPGHHVFHLMRQHGVSVADCALVLVDALRGVDDDTCHCLELARAHSVPVILAINKLDLASSQQIELVYAQLHARGFLSRHVTRDSNPFNQRELLQSHGNLEATEYLPAQDDDTDQGPVIVGVVEISAKTEANVDRLLHAFSEESHVLRECMKPSTYSDQSLTRPSTDR